MARLAVSCSSSHTGIRVLSWRCAAHSPGATARGEGTVLVLEDDEDIRSLLKRFLEATGFTVLSARVAAEAEGILEEKGEEVRLLISDIVLPGGNGLDFYEGVVKRRFPGTKVLFISGYPGRAQVPLLQGKSDVATLPFLEKPFTRGQLLNAVEAVLQV